MKKLNIIIVLLFSVLGTFAQVGTTSQDLQQALEEKEYRRVREDRRAYSEKIEGSPYLTEEYVPSKVFLKNNKKPAKVKLKYNAYADQFQYVQSDREFIVKEEEIDSIEYMNNDFLYTTYINKESGLFSSSEEKKEGYLARLVKGPCSLFKGFFIEFYKASEAKGYESSQPPRFENEEPTYYIQFKEDTYPREIETFRRNKFLEHFDSSLESKLKNYIKDNNIRLRKEEDLVQFIRYYNKHFAKRLNE